MFFQEIICLYQSLWQFRSIFVLTNQMEEMEEYIFKVILEMSKDACRKNERTMTFKRTKT